MIVKKATDVFNLMDTNGRRDDVINALNGYLGILDNLLNVMNLEWKRMPESVAQFQFYKEALDFSEGVFNEHTPYDFVMNKLDSAVELREAIKKADTDWIAAHKDEYPEVFQKIDNGIEDRARHYTSNLVKLGFTDSNRIISGVGEQLLGKRIVEKDELEVMLPINSVNLIYLRQLLKLRIFTKEGDRFYSPFCFAIYILLMKGRVTQSEFAELVQSRNPYMIIDDLESYVKNYYEGQYLNELQINIPEEIDVDVELEDSVLRKYYKNGKSSSIVDKYVEFYQAVYRFDIERTQNALNKLLEICEEHKSSLNSAFGNGKSVFSVRKGERPTVELFLKNEPTDLFCGNVNVEFYKMFYKSKLADKVRENADTTRRIFKASGLISFSNGYAELVYSELCRHIFDIDKIREKSMGLMETDLNARYDCYEEYEGSLNSFYCDVVSITEIFDYDNNIINSAINDIQTEFDGATIEEIHTIIVDRRRREFEDFIEANYSKDRVKYLMSLFSDRSNDLTIKAEVSTEASVPTIYEYVVGLAWYYFSEKRINLLDGYNLTLSADFEPITHAGGGVGDIVIGEDDKVVMLEATLMNANSQKRGEWEPVLRHSANLQIEEENGQGRAVTTFFIADSFDFNTINIWKAISSVPLQSSIDKDKYTENVIIMPISNAELIELMDKSNRYDDVIAKVRESFIADVTTFDRTWRDRFIGSMMAL